jgi:L-fucose/D-arabinose isomerase
MFCPVDIFYIQETDQVDKIVDIYMPLDAREICNETVKPVAQSQLQHLVAVIEALGWTVNLLNPNHFVASVAEGIKVVQKARSKRFINFMAGWAYPDFTVTPMWQLPAETAKLLLGSTIPDFPGAVGLLAGAAGTAHVGIKTSRLYVEEFADRASYQEAIRTFLETGYYACAIPDPIDVPVADKHIAKARKVKAALKGQVYGVVGPRSMEMWNKISEADFLQHFGMAKLSFDGLRLAKMAEKIPVERAKAAMTFLLDNGMELKLGSDPETALTEDMVLFQMQVYCALLELKEQFGLDFIGVQDQLDWIEHYPATDLTLGLLNNKLRPESDGQTFVAATEADDGAAITMQVLKHLTGGEPAGFNDLRYWDASKNLYWFVNSGALAPFFAHGSHDSLKGAWSERQTPMYFKAGGGTSTVVVKKPGAVTWARFSYRDNQLYLCAGRGITDVPTEQQWLERTERCSRDWPQWYLKLCAPIEQKLNSNHPMTVFGDYLADLKALAQELQIPFECYDACTPDDLQ